MHKEKTKQVLQCKKDHNSEQRKMYFSCKENILKFNCFLVFNLHINLRNAYKIVNENKITLKCEKSTFLSDSTSQCNNTLIIISDDIVEIEKQKWNVNTFNLFLTNQNACTEVLFQWAFSYHLRSCIRFDHC